MKTDMRAMVIYQYGNNPVTETRMPIPSMNPNEVRVKSCPNVFPAIEKSYNYLFNLIISPKSIINLSVR